MTTLNHRNINQLKMQKSYSYSYSYSNSYSSASTSASASATLTLRSVSTTVRTRTRTSDFMVALRHSECSHYGLSFFAQRYTEKAIHLRDQRQAMESTQHVPRLWAIAIECKGR